MNAFFGTRWWSWQRLVCLALTVIVVGFLLRRIDREALRHSLAHLQPGWFSLAFGAYGMALLLGGLRWHITLRAIQCVVHVAASVRLSLIGHFFFLIFFGAAAGDVAKSALYARWYGFGVPELAASTPIDRFLGGLAAILVGSAALGVGFFSGGFEHLGPVHLRYAALWIGFAFIVGIALLIALIFWKAHGISWAARGWRTLRAGLRNLIYSPRQTSQGLLLAVLAQLALCCVFAFNVRAVTDQSLPWMKLAWTFPAVMMLSCVPITIAGAGVREMLSLTFLGLYGVPASDCVGAALLTFVCKISWSSLGGLVLWRESTVQLRKGSTPIPTSVSVVIPAINEAESLPNTVELLRRNEAIHEIIVADGGSTDRTPEIAEQLGCRLVTSPPGRGVQMRAGAATATGDVILLLHADTWLPPHGIRALLSCLRDRAVVAGGYWKQFHDPPLLLLGSKWKCAVRLWVGRRVAGDQAMFIRREILEQIGGVPAIELMEEFWLSSRLRRHGRLALADAVIITSARRFRKRGVIRTYLRMWIVTLRYRLGTTPSELRKHYEK